MCGHLWTGLPESKAEGARKVTSAKNKKLQIQSTERRIRINSPYSTLRVCENSGFVWIMDFRKEADMDQIATGKFIAKERKRKGYTQKQLAEILGISDKTISKWERGV